MHDLFPTCVERNRRPRAQALRASLLLAFVFSSAPLVYAFSFPFSIQGEGAALHLGKPLEGELTKDAPVVATELLDDGYGLGTYRGVTHPLRVNDAGEYRIHASSPYFGPYLIVRDAVGAVLFEGGSNCCADGGVPDTVLPLEAGQEYRVVVVSIYGFPGPYDLAVEEPGAEEEHGSSLERAEAALAELEADPDTPPRVVALALHRLGHAQRDAGQKERAKETLLRAIEMREEWLGDHPVVTETLMTLGNMEFLAGRYDEAKELFQRALDIEEAALGEHPAMADALFGVGRCTSYLGDLDGGERLMERAHALLEATEGAVDLRANLGSGLAFNHFMRGNLQKAVELLERSIEILELAEGDKSAGLGALNDNLGHVLMSTGDLARASKHLDEAIRIKKRSGAGEDDLAASRTKLAQILIQTDHLAAAREHLAFALPVLEASLGVHPETSICLSRLSNLNEKLGDLDRAIELRRRALKMDEEIFGTDHSKVASNLNTLGVLLVEKGRYAEAWPLYQRSERIMTAARGPESPAIEILMGNQAIVLLSMGRLDQARELLERSIRMREKRGAPPKGSLLHNLAMVLADQGELEESRECNARAVELARADGGPGHPNTTRAELYGVHLMLRASERDEALAAIREILHTADERRERLQWSLSETERLSFAATQLELLRTFLSVARGHTPEAEREAYERLLGWKAHVLRSLSRTRGQALTELTSEGREVVERLTAVQAQLSKEVYGGGEPSAARDRLIASLREDRRGLVAELSRVLGPQEAAEVPTVAELAAALPEGSALVDFFVAKPLAFSPGKASWEPQHLFAWVLRPGDSNPAWLDLGLASEIEKATRAFLESLVGSRGVMPNGQGVKTPADFSKELREVLWDPVAAKLDDEDTRVFVSADSFLGGLPLEVLQAEDGTYLVEERAFVYLQDASSLAAPMKKAPEAPEHGGLLCIGGVDYRRRGRLEWRGEEVAAAEAGLALRGSFQNRWGRLPATRDEALTIVDVFEESFEDSEAVLLLEDEATEERVKVELERHRVLHLATHGFFQPEGLPSMWEEVERRSGTKELVMRAEDRRLTATLPGLLSGLVLAGANKPDPDRDDGFLTAEEITFLDLSGADLVVLSACESGLGRPASGEGMLGLRRSLRVAGARTVISSLWRVSDEATNDLMQAFYVNLWEKGESRLDALRHAQLAMIKRNRIENDGDAMPTTWGAFVLGGDWE